jgi:cardiolipin synthase
MKSARQWETGRSIHLDGWTGDALTRAGGAPLVVGNRVVLLKDAAENYPAWIAAIESAKQWIHFETYIFHECPIGRTFADLICSKAREGVKVRVIYDWIGSLGYASRRFWRRMMDAGVEVRRFNTPGLENPLGWINRDHRKMIAVDGRTAFVTGLCVGQDWVGYPERGIDPWRDTGLQIQGPALSDIEHAFADSWATAGVPLPRQEQPSRKNIQIAGDVPLRVIAGVPSVGSVYRFDQLIANLARRSIWLSDAYFVGTISYVQALCSAARSGVDVRLLLPGANDMPVMRALARAGLRPLLEAGVRVFEWNGSMMHAKTAVADGYWSRVGSTNLNIESWVNNRELDIIVEDKLFAQRMEQSYLEDLSESTEIVLETARFRPTPKMSPRKQGPKTHRIRAASPTAAAGVMRWGRAVGAAIAHRRELGPAESIFIVWAAVLLLMIGSIAAIWPRAIAIPTLAACIWMSISLFLRAYRLRAKRRRDAHQCH